MSGALKRFGPLAVIAGLVIAAWALGWTHYLNLQTIQQRLGEMKGLVAARPVTSALAFVAIYAVVTAASVPGTSLFTITGGYLFGTWLGGSLTVIAATVGALAAFQAARSAFGRTLRRKAESRAGMMKRISEGVHRNAFTYILSLWLLPFAPFWLVNIASGLADAPLGAYVAATLLGIIPAVFIYSAIGAGLGSAFAKGEGVSPGILAEPQILFPLIGLAVLGLATALFRTWRGAQP